MAFRRRKRARREIPRVRAWAGEGVQGFIGYKAGMLRALVDTPDGRVMRAITVLEVPPLFVYGLRFYGGGHVISDYVPEGVWRKPIGRIPQEYESLRLLCLTSPHLTGIGRKKRRRVEIGFAGGLDEAKALLGKELKAEEVFQTGERVDVIAVTKGHGWQGEVKRFGVSLQRRKATGRRRHVGCLGPWHPAYVMYTTPRAGQTGYHRRTEWNKVILGFAGPEVTPSGGFPHYGVIKTSALLLDGSVPGPQKRAVVLRKAVRKPVKTEWKLAEVIS